MTSEETRKLRKCKTNEDGCGCVEDKVSVFKRGALVGRNGS
jgi:hypothetical protein